MPVLLPAPILRAAPLAILLSALAISPGCGSRSDRPRLSPRPYATSLPIRFPAQPSPLPRVSLREDSRPALSVEVDTMVSAPFSPPPGARLTGSFALQGEAPRDGEVSFSLMEGGGASDGDGASHPAGSIRLAGAPDGAWHSYGFDLPPGIPGPLRLRIRLPEDPATRARILLTPPRLAIPRAPHARRPVVVICADALRADHLSCYDYARSTSPHLDALAREGIRVKAAYTAATWTLPAIASLFTGLHPGGHGAIDRGHALGSAVPTLAERLAQAGYRTAGVVSGSFTAPRFGLARGFEQWIDLLFGSADLSDANHRNLAPAVSDAALDLLGELRGSLFFLFLHYFDPHRDYTPPPPWDTRFDPDYRGTMTGEVGLGAGRDRFHPGMPARDLQHVVALYDGEIGFMDAQIGRVLEALPPDAIILFTADHGEAFFEHGFAGHGPSYPPFDELVRVPLIWRLPEGAATGVTVPGPASLVDVVPTILDLLGLPSSPAGAALEGRSLLPRFLSGGTEPEGEALVEVYPWDPVPGKVPDGSPKPPRRTYTALFDGPWEWIESTPAAPGASRNTTPGATPPGEGERKAEETAPVDLLFDLREDPRERHDRSRERRKVLATLRAKRNVLLEDWMRSRAASGVSGVPVDLSPEQADALHGLGY